MDERWRTLLVGHGALVFLIGLVAGFPFGLLLLGWGMPGDVRAWRMAHLEGLLNGLLLIGVGAAGARLALTAGQQRLVVWALVATAWGNTLASILAPLLRVRGLQPGGSAANTLVFALFTVALVAVLVAMTLVARGAFARLRRPAG